MQPDPVIRTRSGMKQIVCIRSFLSGTVPYIETWLGVLRKQKNNTWGFYFMGLLYQGQTVYVRVDDSIATGLSHHLQQTGYRCTRCGWRSGCSENTTARGTVIIDTRGFSLS